MPKVNAILPSDSILCCKQDHSAAVPQTTRLSGCSFAEAAKGLGITEDAVRKRIKKGTLQGRREHNKLLVVLESLQNNSKFRQAEDGLLLRTLQEEVALLCSQLSVKDQQLSAKDQQLAEKDQHLRQQLAVKDQQIEKLYEDIESWREQVRYKELQIAQLQDRMLPLSSTVEDASTEQGRTQPAQAEESRNALSPFWHWVIGH